MIYTQSVVTINLTHLVENYTYLKNLAPHAIAAGVVKNDAYGLGVQNVVPALEKAGCPAYFVALAVEGAQVRRLAPKADIYVLQGMGDDSVSLFQEHKLIPVISTPQELIFYKQNKIADVKPVLNIETGLNRLGFRPKDWQALSDEDKSLFSFLLSHLACADEANHFMNQHQIQEFERASESFNNIPLTLSASDGVFLGENYQKNMVRLGAAMYGLNTAPYRPNKMKVVLYVKAPILQIADVPQGEYIGYGATYKAPRNMKIAIVSIGYGDGLPRALAGRGRVFINDREARMVGRLSMDNIMVDVTDIPALQEGVFVDILNDTYTADDMGRDAGTIGYEILDGIGSSKRLKVEIA